MIFLAGLSTCALVVIAYSLQRIVFLLEDMTEEV